MQENPAINKDDINKFLCSACGANMVFDAKTQKLACPYCANAQEVVADGVVEERSYEEALSRGAGALQPMASNAMQVSCESCGATVNFTPPETARNCDFCGAKIVAQPKAADPLVAPEGILPFSVTDAQAVEGFNSWIQSLWFAPNALKTMASADKLSSVYIPYWTYDSDTTTSYTGERGEHYQETETYYENGEQKTRTVTKTRWYPAYGTVTRHFDDVCIPATMSLSEKYLSRLEPWDFDQLKSYEPAFLSGHKAQTYQVTVEQGFTKFQGIAENVIAGDVRSDIGGDEQKVFTSNTDYSAITFKHLLLPIYAGAYHFSGKTYQIVVNGRTAEVQGERPYSWIKIGLLVVAILIVVMTILMVVKK